MTHDKILQVSITRTHSSDQGTIGKLRLESLGFSCFTLELPWRDNRPMVSCIPENEYFADWTPSKMLKRDAYRLSPTAPRVGILIHPANLAGDESLGYKAELMGCIALGYKVGQLYGHERKLQHGILESKRAVQDFEALCNKARLKITITNAYPPLPLGGAE